jgi:predicted peroxiredoxin
MITRRRGIIAGAAAGLATALLGKQGGAAQPDTGYALFIATHGADDPNRATFPFFLAWGVVRAGQPAQIFLIGDGTTLVGSGVLESIVAVGPPPMRDIYPDIANVPLLVCMGCARARGITDADVEAIPAARWVSGPTVDALIAGAQRVASF